MSFIDELEYYMDCFTGELKATGHKSEASSFQTALNTFLGFLEDKPYITCVADITRDDIEEYISYIENVDYVTTNPYRPNYVYRRLRALNHFFEYLVIAEDEIPESMVPSPGLLYRTDFPQPNRRGVKHFPVWADKYIHQKILDIPADKENILFRTMMLFLFHTGARSLDVSTIETDTLHKKVKRDWVRIFANKKRREYDIPVVDELARAIRKYKRMMKDEIAEFEEQQQLVTNQPVTYLFAGNRDPEAFKDAFCRKLKDFTDQVLEDARNDGYDTTDLEELHITSHKFRHNVAIKLIRLGADPLMVAEFLGHSDLSMAQAYIQEDMDYINDLYQEFEEDERDEVEPIIVTREQLFDTTEVISKTTVGWCVSICGQSPCGDNAYQCWECGKLEPKEGEEYQEYLQEQLALHQNLLERNEALGFEYAAEKERMVLNRIREFMA